MDTRGEAVGHLASYADIYRLGPLASMQNEIRPLGPLGASLVRARQPLLEVVEPATPDLAISLLVDGEVDVWRDLGDGLRRTSERSNVPGEMALTPHGVEVGWRVPQPHEVLMLGIPFSTASRILDEVAPGSAENLYRISSRAIRNPLLEAVLHGLWRETARGDALAAMFVDQALILVLAELGRESGLVAPAARAPEPRILRATQYLEEHLQDDVTIAQLSDAAALSPRQLLRAFQSQLGETPHCYLQRRRVERAKALLSTTRKSLVEVAFACGFKSQSHFGEMFRKQFGISPGRYRTERSR